LSESDLRERLVYFEQRLAEAHVNCESASAKFSAVFTTEKPKTWPDTIKLIQDRIANIEIQSVG
jgi:hypothetical protein